MRPSAYTSARGSKPQPLDLLGRHVRRRSDDARPVGALQAVAGELSRPQIEHLHQSLVGDEDVFRLQIAVNDVGLVHGADAVGDFGGVVKGVRNRQAPAAVQQIAQGLATKSLHRDPDRAALGDAGIVNPHQVRVPELGQHDRFHLHAGASVFFVAMVHLQAFDGDRFAAQPVNAS